MAYTDEELIAVKAFYANLRSARLCQVPISCFEAVSWQSLPEVAYINCVVVDESAFKLPSYTSPILQSVVETLCGSFGAFGDDFKEEFLKTTHGWSQYWLDDRERLVDWSDNRVIDRWRTDTLLGKILPEFVSHRKSNAIYPSHLLNPPDNDITWDRQTVFDGPIQQANMRYFTFGMGSLINTPSRVGTAGVVAQSAIPVRISASYEFCPCWNFQNYAGGSQLTAGGMVMRSDPRVKDPNAETVGVIYPCPGDDAAMKAQDEREVGYTRYDIPLQHIFVLDHWQKVPSGITVFQYVPNTELRDDHPARAKTEDGSITPRAPFPVREYPLSQTYVDTCILGCLEYSREMAEKWIKGFVGWPEEGRAFWLNDRKVARRPWIEQPKFHDVDDIIRDVIPESFKCRKLPAEYGGHYWDLDQMSEATTPHNSPPRDVTPGMDLDVKYTSYTQHSRDPMAIQCDETPYFVFHAFFLMGKRNWAAFCKIHYKYETAFPGMPCRLAKEAGFRRSFGQHTQTNFSVTNPCLVDAGDQDARDVLGVLQPVPPHWAQSSGEPPAEPADRLSYTFIVPHRRVELKVDHLTVLRSYMCIPQGARVFTYVVNEPIPPSFEWPISQLFLDNVLSACLEDFGEDFCKELVDTTDSWVLPDGQCYWLNDRHLPRRPWVHQSNYKIFDRMVLDSKSPLIPAGTLYKRRLPEEYLVLAPKTGGHYHFMNYQDMVSKPASSSTKGNYGNYGSYA
eukprot:TRINITY_DN72717_c0_g1_i1.p1 TRINITY_DN72717_c0_g1~~TRINITY_DN72717_c0_g1_i1.p1  ORF type:complete len:856 (+),score=102.69 TRINITY_DN72717_c0_g1_i1:367-2568(+)